MTEETTEETTLNTVHLIGNWNIQFKILYVQHMECCIHFFLLARVVPFDLMLL